MNWVWSGQFLVSRLAYASSSEDLDMERFSAQKRDRMCLPMFEGDDLLAVLFCMANGTVVFKTTSTGEVDMHGQNRRP